MLICPSCAFSNPDTAATCMSCGAELPPDFSLGQSISEMSSWYDDAEDDTAPPQPSPAATPPPEQKQKREATGRYSLVQENDLDSAVLGDMEAALDSLIQDDTGVGHVDDDAVVMEESHAADFGSIEPEHTPPTQDAVSGSEPPESNIPSNPPPEAVQSSASSPHPSTYSSAAYVPAPASADTTGGSVEPVVELEKVSTEYDEYDEYADMNRHSDEQTTVAPLSASGWVESAGTNGYASASVPSESKSEEESTLHGGAPPSAPSTSAAAVSVPQATAEDVEPSLHRPAPTDRIDLRELHALLQQDPEAAKALDPRSLQMQADENNPTAVVKTPPTPVPESQVEDFSPDLFTKASEAPYEPTERQMGRWGRQEPEPRNARGAWDATTVREDAENAEEGDVVEELGMDSIVEEEWNVSTSERGLSQEESIEHTLGHLYASPEGPSAQPTSEPSGRSAPSTNQRWIAPDLGPFSTEAPSPPEPNTMQSRWTQEDVAQVTNQEAWNENASPHFAVWQFDAEALQSNVFLRPGQRLQVLSGLIDTVVKSMNDVGLEVVEVQEDLIVARRVIPSNGMGSLVHNCLELMRDVVQRYEPSLHVRLRGRCVVVSLSSRENPGVEDALWVARRLLRGMPVDRVWLNWDFFQRWSQPMACQEVVLPSLEEPAYEVDDANIGPSEAIRLERRPIQPPWVGRNSALSGLHKQWTSLLQHGSFASTLVLGEPGVGRSRLVNEWRRQLQGSAVLFGGGAMWCPPHAGESPYLASLLNSHVQALGIEPNHGLPHRLNVLAQHPDAPLASYQSWYADALLELLAESRSFASQQVEALEWLIRASTVEAPTVLVFDDLYLLDRLSRTLLENLIQNPPARLFIVVVASADEYEEILFSSLPNAEKIQIEPFTQQECYQLVEGQWPDLRSQHEALAHLIDQAQGNPRILLELVRKQLVSEPHSTTGMWSTRASQSQRLKHTILERLRTLSTLEQDTLRKAAVVGDRFWKGSIEAMERLEIQEGNWGLQDGVKISHVDDRSEVLGQLEQKGLIERLALSSVLGEKEYRFEHRLLRDLCQRQLPHSVRQRMHRSVSQWLQARDRERTLVPELAQHLKLAGLHEEAHRELLRVAKEAFAHNRCQHALTLLSTCLDSNDTTHPLLQLKTEYLAGRIYERMGDVRAALELYQKALKRSWQLTDPHWGSRLFLKVARVLSHKGDVTGAESAVLNAQALAQQADDERLNYIGQILQARLALLDGQVSKAFGYLKESKSYLTENNDPLERVHYLLTVGALYRSEGKWSDSVQKLQEAIRMLQDTDQPILYAASVLQLGEFFLAAGDEESAIPLLEKAVDILRPREAYGLLVQGLCYLARAFLLRRNVQQAQSLLQEAWKHCRVSGSPNLIAPTAAALAASSVLVRQSKEALHYARIASKRLSDIPPHLRGWVYHFLGQTATGLTSKTALEIFEQPPTPLPEGGVVTYCYLKGVEMFKHVGDAANQLSSLLALTQALFASGYASTASHILGRGISDAKQLGLGLLLEKMNNQKRLLQGGDHLEPIDESIPVDHSTLVVRKKKIRKAKVYPGAVDGSPLLSTSDRWQSGSENSGASTNQSPSVHVAPQGGSPSVHVSGGSTNILPMPSGNNQMHGVAQPPAPIVRGQGPSRPASQIPRPSYPPPSSTKK